MVNVTAPTPNANKNAPTGTENATGTAENDEDTDVLAEEGNETRTYTKAPKYIEDPAVAQPQYMTEGKLSAWPENIDIETHRISKADVHDETIFLEFKARRMEAQANRIVENARSLRATIEELKQIGDLEVRKHVSELYRTQKKMAKLEKMIADAKAASKNG